MAPPLMVSIIEEPKPQPPSEPEALPKPPAPIPVAVAKAVAPAPVHKVAAVAEAVAASAPTPAPGPPATTQTVVAAAKPEPVHLPPQIKDSCRPPDYPPAAKRLGQTGTVVVKFLIEVDGSVTDSAIETSSGYPRLDEAARDALALCSFKPGTVDGQPEKSWAQVQYNWKLN